MLMMSRFSKHAVGPVGMTRCAASAHGMLIDGRRIEAFEWWPQEADLGGSCVRLLYDQPRQARGCRPSIPVHGLCMAT
jgi:hypothetical protein